MEEAANGPWYFKQNEDGVFVKVNEERVKNKKDSFDGTSPGGQRKFNQRAE